VRPVVIAVGNTYRGDDGVAFAVLHLVQRLAPGAARYLELDGEPTRLLDAWDGAPRAVVIDACRSGAPPGSLRCIDPDAEALPAPPNHLSGHAGGLREALELAVRLDRRPTRLSIVAIEAGGVEQGSALSLPVAAAVPAAARAVLDALSLR
jgi:hydrogenase maturation protease